MMTFTTETNVQIVAPYLKLLLKNMLKDVLETHNWYAGLEGDSIPRHVVVAVLGELVKEIELGLEVVECLESEVH